MSSPLKQSTPVAAAGLAVVNLASIGLDVCNKNNPEKWFFGNETVFELNRVKLLSDKYNLACGTLPTSVTAPFMHEINACRREEFPFDTFLLGSSARESGHLTLIFCAS